VAIIAFATPARGLSETNGQNGRAYVNEQKWSRIMDDCFVTANESPSLWRIGCPPCVHSETSLGELRDRVARLLRQIGIPRRNLFVARYSCNSVGRAPSRRLNFNAPNWIVYPPPFPPPSRVINPSGVARSRNDDGFGYYCARKWCVRFCVIE